MQEQKLSELLSILEGKLNITSIEDKAVEALDTIASLRAEADEAGKALSDIKKQLKNSEAALNEMVLSDKRYTNAEARKNALELEKGGNQTYQDLLSQEQEQAAKIAEVNHKIEQTGNIFKLYCHRIEQNISIINLLANTANK